MFCWWRPIVLLLVHCELLSVVTIQSVNLDVCRLYSKTAEPWMSLSATRIIQKFIDCTYSEQHPEIPGYVYAFVFVHIMAFYITHLFYIHDTWLHFLNICLPAVRIMHRDGHFVCLSLFHCLSVCVSICESVRRVSLPLCHMSLSLSVYLSLSLSFCLSAFTFTE